MKSNLKASHSFNEDSIEISITEAEKTKQQWDKVNKKDAEKKDLKKDMKFDKDSKKKMEADYEDGGKKIKPKKSYAQMLTDIAAERFGKKKEVS